MDIFKSLSGDFNLENIFGKQLIDKSATNYIQSVFDQINDGSLNVDTLAKSTSKLDKELVSYIKTSESGTRSTEDFNEHITKSGTSLTKLSVTSKLAKVGVAALNATLTMGASLLAGLVLEKAISWFDDLIHKTENLADAAQTAIAKIQDLKDEFKNNKQYVDDNAQRFAQLSQGTNELGDNRSLSTDDYEEFLAISNKLAEIFPTLSRTYDDNGNAIVRLDGNVNDIVGSLQRLIEAETDLTHTNIAAELPTIFENVSNQSQQYEKSLEDFNNQRKALVDTMDYLRDADLSLDNQWIDISGTDTESLYQIKDAYTKALNDAKIAYEEMTPTMGLDEYGMSIPIGFSLRILDETGDNAQNQVKTAISEILKQYDTEIGTIDEKIDEINKQHEQTWNSLNQSIASWLYTDSDYKVLDDATQGIVQQMVNSVQWGDLDFSSWDEAQGYIESNVLDVFTGDTLSSELKNRLLSSLQQGSLSDSDYITIIQKLQTDINAYLAEHNIDIEFSLDFLIANQTDTEQRLQSKIRELVKSPEDMDLAEQYLVSAGVDTTIEKEAFLDAASGVNTLNEAFVNYNETIAKTAEEVKKLNVINEELDKIQSAYQTVSGAVKEYSENKALSLDTVQSLLSLDDEYLQVLYDENGQLTLNKDAYKDLAKARLYDLYVKLASETTNMLSSLESEETATAELEESIDDLIIAKKEDIEAGILQAETALLNAQILGEDVSNRQQLLNQIKNQYSLLNTMSDSLSYENFWGDDSESNSGADKFEADINWIDNSLENINREIDSINDKIENTHGFEDRLKLYDDLDAANQKLVNATKEATEAYEQEWIEASSKISDAYKQKIISGETFKIEDFDNETLYNNVVNSQKSYQQWQSSIAAQDDAVTQQQQGKDRRIEDLIAQEEIKLELNSLDMNEAKTANAKNALLRKENQIKANILEYNKQLAKTEEEKLQYQKEYNQGLDENAKKMYENNQSELGNKTSYYDSRIQDIQNAIDLEEAKGGQGTEEQYLEMNAHHERNKEIYGFMYDNALDARNSDDVIYGSDEWEYYNQQVQEAENNINKCTIAQLENNRAILSLPIKPIEDLNEELQEELDLQTKNREQIESAIGYASTLVQDQIDLLNENKESISDYYDAQIKPLEKQKEALTESNNELQRQIDLENARYNLEKALNNKTTRVYRKDEGFVYEANQEDVRSAQNELDDLEYQNEIANLDNAIDALNKQKESEIEVIDEKIETWEDYAKQIDKVTSSYERLIAMQDFISVFGSGGISQILSQDPTILADAEGKLNTAKTKEDELKAKIDANNQAIQAIQKEAEAYLKGSKDIVQARQKIDEIVLANQDELEAIGARTTKTGEYAGKWSTTEQDIVTALGGVETANITSKDNEKTTLDEREENLRLFKEKAIGYYNEIATAVTSAKTSLTTLQGLLDKAKSTYGEIAGLTNAANGGSAGGNLPTYHSGGIVSSDDKNMKLSKLLMSLTDSPLQPNETLAKLLKGEVVLNNGQVSTLFNNLSKVSALPANSTFRKSSDAVTSISIGDVNVYNPDNSDMIVNEIVKELPLKVIQKLNSK